MIIPFLGDWQPCPHCGGTGLRVISRGTNKGKVVRCTHCKGKGGWMIPLGLTIVGVIILISLLHAFQ